MFVRFELSSKSPQCIDHYNQVHVLEEAVFFFQSKYDLSES